MRSSVMRSRIASWTAGLLTAGALTMTAFAANAAQEAEGVWVRDDGLARIEFSPCGKGLCGAIIWLKDAGKTKAKVGERVFFDMIRSDSNSWTGSAFNPEDGKTYSGKMVLSGRKLRTSGCVPAA